MAAFLKLDTSTSPPSVKQASGTDYDYAVNEILSLFAASDTGVGTVSVNPASTVGLTSIGTFTDTYYNALPGDHPIGTTPISTLYTFYQDRQTATESLTRPVEFSAGAMQEQTDTSLNADLISTALANLVSLGVGSYNLGPTAPVGGTWVSKGTITNTLDANGTNNNSTYLWRKTAPASAPATVRPIKINATTPVSTKEMSDAEIETLTNRLRNRINATGIGSYAVQTSAPVGGTWTTAGAQFLDTTRTQSTITYNGTYAGTYNQAFAGTYNTTYTGAYTGIYAGTYGGTYGGTYAGLVAKTFGGLINKGFTGSYTGLTKYAGFARGGSPAVAYAGTYFGNYARGYTGNYVRNYTGAYTGAYTGSYTGIYSGSYVRGYTGSYTGSFTGNYTGAYSGVTLNNDSSNVGLSNIYLWIRTA
jgi:hypothetical protein